MEGHPDECILEGHGRDRSHGRYQGRRMSARLQRGHEHQAQEQRLPSQELASTAGGARTSSDQVCRRDGDDKHGDREELRKGRRASSHCASEQEHEIPHDVRSKDVIQSKETDHVNQSGDDAKKYQEPEVGLSGGASHRSARLAARSTLRSKWIRLVEVVRTIRRL
jgi:hypothetical protein